MPKTCRFCSTADAEEDAELEGARVVEEAVELVLAVEDAPELLLTELLTDECAPEIVLTDECALEVLDELTLVDDKPAHPACWSSWACATSAAVHFWLRHVDAAVWKAVFLHMQLMSVVEHPELLAAWAIQPYMHEELLAVLLGAVWVVDWVRTTETVKRARRS